MMKIKISLDGIFVNQPQYAAKMLKKFSYEDVFPVRTPIERGMVTEKPYRVVAFYIYELFYVLILALVLAT